MRRFKSHAVFVLVLAVSSAPGGADLRSKGQSCENKLAVTKATSVISPLESMVRRNRFNVWRGIVDYADCFGTSLTDTLKQMKAGEIWLDAGAGLGRAQIEFFARRPLMRDEYGDLIDEPRFWPGDLFATADPGIHLVALSLKYPMSRARSAQFRDYRQEYAKAIAAGRFEYLEEDITVRAENRSHRGTVSLITDLYGPLRYSDFNKVLDSYLKLLKPGGRLLIYAPVIEILHKGNDIPFTEFLSRCKGFTFESRTFNDVSPAIEVLTLTRTKDPISVPKLVFKGENLKGSWFTKDYIRYEWP